MDGSGYRPRIDDTAVNLFITSIIDSNKKFSLYLKDLRNPTYDGLFLTVEIIAVLQIAEV